MPQPEGMEPALPDAELKTDGAGAFRLAFALPTGRWASASVQMERTVDDVRSVLRGLWTPPPGLRLEVQLCARVAVSWGREIDSGFLVDEGAACLEVMPSGGSGQVLEWSREVEQCDPYFRVGSGSIPCGAWS